MGTKVPLHLDTYRRSPATNVEHDGEARCLLPSKLQPELATARPDLTVEEKLRSQRRPAKAHVPMDLSRAYPGTLRRVSLVPQPRDIRSPDSALVEEASGGQNVLSEQDRTIGTRPSWQGVDHLDDTHATGVYLREGRAKLAQLPAGLPVPGT